MNRNIMLQIKIGYRQAHWSAKLKCITLCFCILLMLAGAINIPFVPAQVAKSPVVQVEPVNEEAASSHPYQPPNLLENADFAQGLTAWERGRNTRTGDDRGPWSFITQPGQRFPHILHYDIKRHPGDPAWAVELRHMINHEIPGDHALEVRVWMRSPEGCIAYLQIQKSQASHESLFSKSVTLTSEWQQIVVRGQPQQSYAPGALELTFHLASSDGSIELADVQLLDRLPQPQVDLRLGHGGVVKTVAFSPDRKMIATGSWDQSIKLWDAESGTLWRTIQTGEGIYALVFSPNSKIFISGGGGTKIKLWDVQTGMRLSTLEGHDEEINALALSPDGQILVSGCHDGTIKIWDMTTRRVIRTIAGHSKSVTSLSCSGDGTLLASGSADHNIRLWDMASGTLKNTLAANLDSKSGEVLAVALSPDGTLLASGSEDNVVRLWDTRTGVVQTLLQGHKAAVNAVSFSADGTLLASGSSDNTSKIWEVKTGTLKSTLNGHNAGLKAVTFSLDNKTLATGSMDGTAKVWDLLNGQELRTLGRGMSIFSLTAAPDGTTLAAGNEDNVADLWNTRTGELTRTLVHLGPVRAVAFAPDGQTLASAGNEKNIKLWHVATGSLQRALTGFTGDIRCLAFAPNSRLLVSAGDDFTIRVWNTEDGILLRTLTGHGKMIRSLSISGDGRMLASGSEDQTVKLWDIATGALLQTFDTSSPVWSVAFSPDGKLVASGSADWKVRLWDPHSGNLVNTLLGYAGMVFAVTFSPDGRLVVGSNYNEIKVWDTQTGKMLRSLNGHKGKVFALCFLRDGHLLASGGEDQIKLWNLDEGHLLATLYGLPPEANAKPIGADARPLTADARNLQLDRASPNRIAPNTVTPRPLLKGITADSRSLSSEARSLSGADDYLVVTPDGYYSGSSAADRYVRCRLGIGSYPVECFAARYYRPDLVHKALSGSELEPLHDLQGPYPPLLRFVDYDGVKKISGPAIPVTVEATDDSGIREIQFKVNGSNVEASKTGGISRPITADSREIIKLITTSIPVQGPTTTNDPATNLPYKSFSRFTAIIPVRPDETTITIQATAIDEDGLKSPALPEAEIVFNHERELPVRGMLRGLCVGISDYQDPRLNLRYADVDATALQEVLSHQGGIYSRSQITALTNEKATRINVKVALDDLIRQTTPNDTVVLLLSGHGWRTDDRTFYFATYEVNRMKPAETALPWSDVLMSLIQLSRRSKQVLVFLDACHSGSAANNEDLIKAASMAGVGVIIFASSKGSEPSLELSELRHGAFTKALLDGFNGQAIPTDEKTASILDLMQFVTRRVKKWTEDKQHPNVPYLNQFNTDATLITTQ